MSSIGEWRKGEDVPTLGERRKGVDERESRVRDGIDFDADAGRLRRRTRYLKVLLKDNGTWVGLGATAASNPSADDYSDTDSVIRAYCQSQWRTDFNMQSYCIKNQKAAIAVLLLGKPHDISQDQFVSVRQECANQWETDFSMREYCEKQQYSAIRELKQ